MATLKYTESLSDEAGARYKLKLEAVGLEFCPMSDVQTWLNDPCGWPSIEYGDIYNFLIESPSKHCYT
jgi:hypothetical protein